MIAYYAMEHKIVNFFPKIADAYTGAKILMTKATGPQKHEHSPEIKTNCYIWTSSNCPSYTECLLDLQLNFGHF